MPEDNDHIERRYDHRSHASNEGDVVKHVALVGSSGVASKTPQRGRYVDTFAGPAGSLLLLGGEWERGIGALNCARDFASPDLRFSIRWYLSRPQLAGSRYPGSALIAADMGASSGKKLVMTLWDISEAAVAVLRQVFPAQTVINSAIDPSAKAVQSADLFFVDPPGVATKSKLSFPRWPLLLQLMTAGRHMLAWLPINVAVVEREPRVSELAEAQLRDVLDLRYVSALCVLWASAGRTIGCHLVYRSSPDGIAAIRAAVDEVVCVAAWCRKKVEHLN